MLNSGFMLQICALQTFRYYYDDYCECCVYVERELELETVRENKGETVSLCIHLCRSHV